MYRLSKLFILSKTTILTHLIKHFNNEIQYASSKKNALLFNLSQILTMDDV